MKKILIPILALVMLLSGGAGAYFYMGQSEASTGEPAKAEAKAEGGAAGEGGKISYIQMDPIVLPIIDREGISQTISLVVSIQVNDAGKVEEVKTHLPKLADAYLSDMYGTLSKKAAMEHGVIKVSTLKTRLSKIANDVMGEGAVDGVLLQVLQQHPI